MDVDKLHLRYTAYYTILMIGMVGLNTLSVEDDFWLLLPFMLIVFGFLFFGFRFAMRHRPFVQFRFATLSGIKGFMQALVFIGWLVLLLLEWFANSSTKNSFFMNAVIAAWFVMSFLVTYWLFTKSKKV